MRGFVAALDDPGCLIILKRIRGPGLDGEDVWMRGDECHEPFQARLSVCFVLGTLGGGHASQEAPKDQVRGSFVAEVDSIKIAIFLCLMQAL
jgi:hypothetical protein